MGAPLSPEKNKLTAADAQRVEEAFEARLTSLAAAEHHQPEAEPQARNGSEPESAKETRRPQADRQERPHPCQSRAGFVTASTSSSSPPIHV